MSERERNVGRPKVSLVLIALLLLSSCARKGEETEHGAPSLPTVRSQASVTPVSAGASAPPARPADASPPDVLPACRDTLLTGSIGPNPIVMQLRRCGEVVGGRYYYRQNHESLMLFGSMKPSPGGGERIELQELGADGQPFKPNGATLSGRVSGGERMEVRADSAVWRRDGVTLRWEASENTTGETYSSLRATAGPPKTAADGSFSYRTVKHLWEYVVCASEGVAPPGPIEVFPDAARDFLSDGCRGARRVTVDASWPEVVDGRATLDVAATNRTLLALLNQYVPLPTEVAGGSTSARVVAARGRVLSFIVKTDGVHQGAYPDHTEYGTTIDLRDGRRLATADLLDVRDTTAFEALLEKRLPLLPAGGGEACRWADTELMLHVGEDGLRLTPDFPHAAKACQYVNLARLLPRDLAVRYVRPGSLLDEVMAGRWGP